MSFWQGGMSSARVGAPVFRGGVSRGLTWMQEVCGT
jgi:hypothetical protein